ncbi:MAG: hypothetical protein U0938_00140, partial [Thiobacillus sp.]|nr:hypothetical protein [Thiobacillus sp.]
DSLSIDDKQNIVRYQYLYPSGWRLVAPPNVTAVTESINVPLPPPETAGQIAAILSYVGEYLAGPALRRWINDR